MKIIFIDIDGTLCNSNGEITKETIDAINKVQKQGNIVVLSTGRRLNRVIPLMENCNINSYILALNGAQIYDFINDKILFEEDIGFDNCCKIYNLIKEYSLKGNFHTGILRYTTSNPYSDDILLINENFCELKFKKIPQIVISSDNFNSLLNMKIKLGEMCDIKIVNQSRDMLYENLDYKKNVSFIDISVSSVSKGNGIKYLLDYLGFTKEDSIAIGDGINDMSMFEVVGTKVAMGNADSFLKEKADYITLSNDENGVAYYLEKLIK